MRLFDHAMEHLYCRASDWYQGTPDISAEESLSWKLCGLLNRYYGRVETRYQRKRVAAWDTVLALFKGA